MRTVLEFGRSLERIRNAGPAWAKRRSREPEWRALCVASWRGCQHFEPPRRLDYNEGMNNRLPAAARMPTVSMAGSAQPAASLE